jgi:hypothetical protein
LLNVVAREKQKLALSVKGDSLAGFVNFVCALEILFGTLGQLSLSGVDDLVQVVNLTEITHLGAHETKLVLLLRCSKRHA